MQELPLIARARDHQNVAIQSKSDSHSYQELLEHSSCVASALGRGVGDLQQARVAFLLPPGADYVTAQWGIWRAGGVAVPLSISATSPELNHVLCDADPRCVITSPKLVSQVSTSCTKLDLPVLYIDDLYQCETKPLPFVASERRAMILYTSGTTSKPKGVVSTHAGIEAQIRALVHAWRWEDRDRIPLFLSLHHIHGIINVLSCALWAGATVESFPGFEIDSILNRVAAGAYTIFMAVPTIYVKLIQIITDLTEEQKAPIIHGFSAMRCMVSGSAALPATVHKQWTQLTGQHLLERYGMTEIGMALSNPYDGERRPGTVGQPLAGVEVRLRSEQGVIVTEDRQPGEIQVRGPAVFQEYWNRPDVTVTSFEDGWFRTGDVAVIEDGYYRIMGRQSVDIIKTGGYKVSALEIEATLLDHPNIKECTVVGLPDETWGEIVAAAIVSTLTLSLESLQEWCKDRLSSYKVPRQLINVDQLPRNAMGKVTKPSVRDLF